jgi:hypothetical protein
MSRRTFLAIRCNPVISCSVIGIWNSRLGTIARLRDLAVLRRDTGALSASSGFRVYTVLD